MSKNEQYPFVWFIIATTIFGLIPNTFLNYGWDYYQFLPLFWLLVPIALVVSCIYANNIECISKWIIIPTILSLAFSFILFRTQIHAFGGDTYFDPLLLKETVTFLPKLTDDGIKFNFRLEVALLTPILNICRHLNIFEHTDKIPIMVSAAIYSIVIGILYLSIAGIAFRKRVDLFLIVATAPFVFNFFGNTDSYALSLCSTLLIFIACLKLWNLDRLKFIHLVLFGFLALFDIFIHPLHVYIGFFATLLVTKYLKQFEFFKWLPKYLLLVLFTLVFFIAVKSSITYGNTWFSIREFRQGTAHAIPIFSLETFSHWLNIYILQCIPLMIAVYKEAREKFKECMLLFICQSAVFVALAFGFGADDQYNYQQLFFYFMIAWLLAFANKQIKPKTVLSVVACQLVLLIPMVAVNSSHAVLDRADAVYPLDECGHNNVMSWQVHMGLVLSDNYQNDPQVWNAVLKTFDDGAKNAKPELRMGNFIYHTAFLYQYGKFTQGRKQLWWLLTNYPQTINQFISIRPGFIACNRKILWKDIEEFLIQVNSPDVEIFKNIRKQLENSIHDIQYYDHLPSWAITE